MDAPSPNYAAANFQGRNGEVLQADPSKAFAFFFSKAKQIPSLSREEGKPVWQDRDYIRVQQPGERDAVELEATEVHKARWPREWEHYKAGRTVKHEGTPLSLIFPDSEAMILNLRSLAIYTVEELADIPDSATGTIPFGGTLKDKAKKYLAAQNGAQGFNKLNSELEEQRKENQSLKLQIENLQTQFTQLAAEREGAPPSSAPGLSMDQVQRMIAETLAATQTPKRGPGRPPKDHSASPE